MKLYRYESLAELNKALADFGNANVPIAKVKLLSESDFFTDRGGRSRFRGLKTVFFILTNEKGDYQEGKKQN